MGFNTSKFQQARLEQRTDVIKVPEMKAFFDEGDDHIWEVRGLTASELAMANEAMAANKDMGSIISAIATGGKDKVDAVKELMGLQSDSVPDDIVRRISMLTVASISPEIDQTTAVRLGNTFPTTFYKITNKIIELTGLGYKLGE